MVRRSPLEEMMAEQAPPQEYIERTAKPPAGSPIDLIILGALAAMLLVGMTPLLGVWEPWESAVANALDLMRTGSPWTVMQPGDTPVAELPYGLWPSAGLSTFMGVNAWSLRLPGMLLGVLTCLVGFGVTRRLFGRPAAWLGALGLLSMPMFIFHTRLAFGTAVGMQCSALAALGFLHLLTAPYAGWRAQLGTWLAFAGAGLAAGVAGLAGPLGVIGVGLAVRARQVPDRVDGGPLKPILEHGLLVVLIACVALFGFGQQRWGAIVAIGGVGLLLIALLFGADMRTVRRAGDLRRVAPLPLALGAMGLIGAGWYLAVSHLPEGQSARALLLWLNDFDGPGGVKDRPGFDTFTHQIGFGLFPLGAFIPLAFADLIWSKADQDATRRLAALALAGWFGLSFIAPALGVSFSHVGFFFGAPAVAIAVGVYFHRAVTGPPQPLLAFVAVLLLALIDSNLKHQTQALADTLVGAEVDAFPPKLAGWWMARGLSAGLLCVLILYQGGLIHLIRPGVQRFFYPSTAPRRFNWWTAVWAFVGSPIVGGLLVLAIGPRRFANWVNGAHWTGLAVWARGLVLWLLVFALTYVAVHFLWRWRARQLAQREREGGALLSFTTALVDFLRPASRALIGLLGILLAWVGFMNVGVTRAMSTNFSQKDIISRYAELQQGDEPLLTYQMGRDGMFYARDLERLDRAGFRGRIGQSDRIFFMIPRKNLAAVNKSFRATTGRTLPILDDRSYRVLLASNQIKDGEEDFNPITRALIKELPPGVNKTNHVFDDRIELVGWQLNPVEPRPGAELTISLFWRAKKRISGRWKVFVHIDAPGQRIHGDHDPVAGMFPTDNWNPGDLIRDDHLVQVKRTTGKARYTFYVGLFRGNTRMPITQGDKDNVNRAKIGRVRVR